VRASAAALFARALSLSLFLFSVGAIDGHSAATRQLPSSGPPSLERQLARLGALERARTRDRRAIVAALRSPSETVRRRAVLALGRLRDSLDAPALGRLVHDSDAGVRAELAFSLGQIGARAPAASLTALARDPEREVRVEAADALGKLGPHVAIAPLLRLAGDAAADVRGAAALGLARRGDSLGVRTLVTLSADADDGVRWRATYALEKVVWPEIVVPAVRARLADSEALVRMYAVRTLGRQKDPRAIDDIENLLFDRDPHVVVNAVRALGAFKDTALVGMIGSQPFAVRPPPVAAESLALSFLYRIPPEWKTQILVTLAGALGQIGRRQDAPLLIPALRHPSPQVRYSVAGALVGILGASALPHLMDLRWDPSQLVRNHVTDLLGDVPSEAATKRLIEALERPEGPSLRVFAASALEKRKDTLAVPALIHALDAYTWPVAAAAASALGAIGDPAAVQPLERAFRRWSGPEAGDARLEAVKAIAAIGDSTAHGDSSRAIAVHGAGSNAPRAALQSLAREALADPDARVREAAADALRRHLGRREASNLARAVGPPRRASRVTRSAPAAEPYERMRSVSADLTTERGVIRLRLFPQDAPQTVANFVALSRSGYFNGLIFHRVVPNFVIQAGDPDSTGWGGPGYAIPDEFNRHRYHAGVLGMALSGPDTGGSQWFITHSPQPHLDGRYTVFGEVTEGMTVVNAIEEGDAIVSITIDTK
jgi:cyclophilin family peptidyl-prolyl cis-trans isomerase/HEAT repeat protein